VVCWIGASFVSTKVLSVAEGRQQLEAIGVQTYDELSQAIQAAVEVANK